MQYQYITKRENYIFIIKREDLTTKSIKKYHKSRRKSTKTMQFLEGLEGQRN